MKLWEWQQFRGFFKGRHPPEYGAVVITKEELEKAAKLSDKEVVELFESSLPPRNRKERRAKERRVKQWS